MRCMARIAVGDLRRRCAAPRIWKWGERRCSTIQNEASVEESGRNAAR